ncbi:Uncharacterised protein [Moraxella lacunata]|uniref:Uncharacterized protein n=1 Tax=Moraxella lacunata TaxID=477 RepID=A0A378UBT5_MORLA|nr:hypothetical protein [Moraxella lacunata]STZ74854.1 Uncharacterised protein [Moraxella lacunata]
MWYGFGVIWDGSQGQIRFVCVLSPYPLPTYQANKNTAISGVG